MAKVYAMIANGTEEVECLAVVDLLRRSGVETVLVSVEEGYEIISSHNVRITAGFEKEFGDGRYTHQGVVTDGNLTTARGLGFAVDMGLELVELLLGSEAAEETRRRIQYR